MALFYKDNKIKNNLIDRKLFQNFSNQIKKNELKNFDGYFKTSYLN